jgi:hypothetical protein
MALISIRLQEKGNVRLIRSWSVDRAGTTQWSHPLPDDRTAIYAIHAAAFAGGVGGAPVHAVWPPPMPSTCQQLWCSEIPATTGVSASN